jgi:putative flippase GtrA
MLRVRDSLRRGGASPLARFAVSSGTSAAVTVGLPVLLHEFGGAREQVAVAISQGCVLLINFVMIRTFVFRSRRARGRDLSYYLASAVAFRGLEYGLFLLLFEAAGLFYVVALVATLGISTVVKFVWYRLLFASPVAP